MLHMILKALMHVTPVLSNQNKVMLIIKAVHEILILERFSLAA